MPITSEEIVFPYGIFVQRTTMPGMLLGQVVDTILGNDERLYVVRLIPHPTKCYLNEAQVRVIEFPYEEHDVQALILSANEVERWDSSAVDVHPYDTKEE